MKKSQKILTALVLSTTLAMGAVPAFAVDPSVGNAGSFDTTENTASTQMNVYTIGETQIQATVPVAMTVVSPVKGGVITAPSATAYKIVNNGTTDIKVTQIKGVDNAGWEIKETLEAPGAIKTTGQMKLAIKAGSSPEVPITSAVKTLDEADAANFVATAKGGELGLTISGMTAVPEGSPLQANKSYPAVKIQYTVAKVEATPAS